MQLKFRTAFDRIEKQQNAGSGYVGVLLNDAKRNGQQQWVGTSETKVPMDMLICAGGANDRIRNKYLGACGE